MGAPVTLTSGGFVKGITSILGKVQGAQYSPASPAAADGFRAFDIDVQPQIEVLERAEEVGVLGRPASSGIGQAHRILTFKSYLAGWGSTFSDAPPELDALFRCAKLLSTPDATGQTYRYDPITSGEKWSTFKVYWDQVFHTLTDCQANVKFSGEIGKPMVVEATVHGLWVALADLALVTPTGLHTTKAPVLKGAKFTLGGDYVPISKFEFDMANPIYPLPDPNIADGVSSFKITDRNPVGSFDPEMTLVAKKDYETLLKNGTTGILSCVLDGGTGNKITLYFGQVQIIGLAPSVEGNIRRYNLGFAARYSSGDDDFYLQYE